MWIESYTFLDRSFWMTLGNSMLSQTPTALEPRITNLLDHTVAFLGASIPVALSAAASSRLQKEVQTLDRLLESFECTAPSAYFSTRSESCSGQVWHPRSKATQLEWGRAVRCV